MKRENEKRILMPLAICALLLSLLLILLTDASRLLTKKNGAIAAVQILLEDMDKETAEALASESAFVLEGASCSIASIGKTEPQSIRITTRDGRILALPSERLFCARLTLYVQGTATEDGFLAGGSHRLLVGSRLRLEGMRMTASGVLLSVATVVS